MNQIHSTALISEKAVLGDQVQIGSYSVIGDGAEIGDGCVIGSCVTIQNQVKLGENCKVYHSAAIGLPAQDVQNASNEGKILIGSDCVFREGVTVHLPIHPEENEVTEIGSGCYFMANSHIAHNCIVGDSVILANGVLLAGHVTVENSAFISGNSAVHQFCRVGESSMNGGLSKIVQDVPPFATADGNPALFKGINSIGLRRRGFTAAERKDIKKAYQIIYSDSSKKETLEELEALCELSQTVKQIKDFYRDSKRGLIKHA